MSNWTCPKVRKVEGGGGTLPAFDQTAAALLLWPGAFDLGHVTAEAGDKLTLTPVAAIHATSVRRGIPRNVEAVRQAIVQLTR